MKRFLITILVLASACSKPKAPPHGASFSLVGAAVPSTSQVGLRCILHTDSLTARVDSCAVNTPPVTAIDTVVATVKVSPNPVTLGVGQTFQLTGGAYNAAGQLIPNVGYWISVDSNKVSVNKTGLVTAKALTVNTNVEFHWNGNTKVSWAGIKVVAPTVYIRPVPSSVDVADLPITLCAFVVEPDKSVAIGIDPKNPAPDSTKAYCSGAPLTKFLAEASH